MLSILKSLFTNSENGNSKDSNYYYEETKRIWNRYSRYEMMNSLKEYGLYNDYKDYSNQYIIDKISQRAKTFNKIYK